MYNFIKILLSILFLAVGIDIIKVYLPAYALNAGAISTFLIAIGGYVYFDTWQKFTDKL